MSCVEALIQASNHETNDDDVDGRTPLLLACLNGHHQAVQVLLALGGDVTKRSVGNIVCDSGILSIDILLYYLWYRIS